MKLVTHNFLACNVKGVKNGYPLKIDAETVEVRDADFDPGERLLGGMRSVPALMCERPTFFSLADFIKKMMKRLDYDALKQAAKQMGVEGLPDVVDEARLEIDDDLLQLLHHAMLEVHLEEGNLICPESGRKFPVSAGIPNMLLHEDEVH